jgi:hypothetical protein
MLNWFYVRRCDIPMTDVAAIRARKATILKRSFLPRLMGF